MLALLDTRVLIKNQLMEDKYVRLFMTPDELRDLLEDLRHLDRDSI